MNRIIDTQTHQINIKSGFPTGCQPNPACAQRAKPHCTNAKRPDKFLPKIRVIMLDLVQIQLN